MKKLFFFALILRLSLSFLTNHPDTSDFLGWSKDLERGGLKGIYERDIDNAGPANYPPIYYLYLNNNNKIYQAIKGILWSINSKITFFPSNIYLFFESDAGRLWFNKLTPIFFDLGVGYMIYLIVNKFKGKNSAKLSSALYLLVPPSWYISSLWGQIDSIYIFFLLLSFYLLLQKRTAISIIFMALSLSVKPNAVYILPVFLIFLLRNTKPVELIKGVTVSLSLYLLSAAYFADRVNLMSIVTVYTKYVREISGYISSNAFNFWGMLYGFGPNADSVKVFGLNLFWWGILLYLIIVVIISLRFMKNITAEQYIFSSMLLSFGSFLFLTRMHERYFYPVYVLLLIVSFIYPNIRKFYFTVAVIFILNLYHYWWYPYSDISKHLFSLRIIETVLCLLNLWVFYKVLKFHIKNN